MSRFDKSDCLARFDAMANRPTSDEVTSTVKYGYLADAQNAVVEQIAAIYPFAMYNTSGPQALSTSDSKVFTFGTDADGSSAQAPMGHVGIYTSLAAYPDNPWIEGEDYHNEGTQIRLPNNRTYGGTLYWQGILTPKAISASDEPTLRPAPARVLIVIEAVKQFAGNIGDAALYSRCAAEWQQAFPRWMLVYRTQFRKGGGLVITSKDVAIARQGMP